MVVAPDIDSSNAYGPDLMFRGIKEYYTSIKAERAKRQAKLKEIKDAEAYQKFMGQVMHNALVRKDFFDFLLRSIRSQAFDAVKKMTKEEAIVVANRMREQIELVRLANAEMKEFEFDNLDDFNAHQSVIATTGALIDLFSEIELISQNGYIDEDSPEFEAFLKREVDKNIEESPKSKVISSLDDYFNNL